MLRAVTRKTLGKEGYIYAVYGDKKYLKHAVASVISLRRHDTERPVALICEKKHRDILDDLNLLDLFDVVYPLAPDHCSIVGFKHNIHEYMLFERNMYLDSDIVWCKNPDSLWQSFSTHPFTITGTQVSDSFFGGPKNIGVIADIILRRRARTLKRFGLTYLSRVQTGMIFAQDHALTKKVCTLAGEMLNRKKETHFRSRTLEEGRSEESCEWSLAMAMSKLSIPVFPWLQGHTSPQLDFIDDMTSNDPDFEYVSCTYYSNPQVYNLRGLNSPTLRKLLFKIFSIMPGTTDYLQVTPYCLHFGWYHQKQPFYEFSERVWNRLKASNEKYGITETRRRVLSGSVL
jgi:hypothetical protein